MPPLDDRVSHARVLLALRGDLFGLLLAEAVEAHVRRVRPGWTPQRYELYGLDVALTAVAFGHAKAHPDAQDSEPLEVAARRTRRSKSTVQRHLRVVRDAHDHLPRIGVVDGPERPYRRGCA